MAEEGPLSPLDRPSLGIFEEVEPRADLPERVPLHRGWPTINPHDGDDSLPTTPYAFEMVERVNRSGFIHR